MSQVALGRHISAQLLSASRSATYGGSLCGSRAFGADRLLCAGGKVEPDAKVVSTRAYRTFTVGIAESSGLGKGIAGVDMASRGPASLEARMLMNPSRRESIRAIRREPISQAQRNAELEEEAKRIDLAPHKLLEKGEPDTMQAIIKDVIPVGYFLTLPNGRDGYLPALDLGFTGGIVILERLFKVGQELTVRVVRRGGGGREILSMKKPEFAPNTDPRFVFSERGGFGNSSNTSGGRS